MKKLSLYTFLVLMWCNVGFAEDISELQIEGFSIGDSLLDHMSKEEIISEIENNKNAYNYLTDEFGEVYLFKNYEKYDYLSFLVKPKDTNYIIYYIGGTIKYDNKIKQCRKKQKEVYREISSQFNVIRKEENSALYPWDSTGKSINHYISLFLMSGDEISISCAEFEKNIKIENNYIDGLTVEISTKEVSKWMRNYIN
tara:strand:- start:724 stop:1317 length:594 start_codon:yes stop_codon:yes gene_type:complete